MKTYNNDPNFSIVAPGGCNAKCSFCFNNNEKLSKFKPCSTLDYILNLNNILTTLPKQFYQISITGNEPMLSPQIENILEMCSKVKNKYTNILLTTNGTNLLKHFDLIIKGVHHINISRHHYDFEENKKIFKGSWNVTDEELSEIIDKFSKYGVDVSLNCVINDNTTREFIDNYINFAKQIGAYAIRFRKENGTLDWTPVETEIDKEYPILTHGTCPVCRTDLRIIKGFQTFWKSSVLEPSDIISDTVYELVYQPNGKIYLDWDGNKEYKENDDPDLNDLLEELTFDSDEDLKKNIKKVEKLRKSKKKHTSSESTYTSGCKGYYFTTDYNTCGIPKLRSSC